MKNKLAFLFLFFITATAVNVTAQVNYEKFFFDSTANYRIELNDGSVFIGKYIRQEEKTGVFKTASVEEIKIPFTNIVKAERIDVKDFVNGKYWFANPNATRYFFGPSAFNLRAGEGYYQNTYLLLNSFNVGLTDNVSIGAGLEILTTFGVGADVPRPLFFFTPKVGFPVAKKLHVGAGALYASIPNYNDNDDKLREGFGIGYVMGTYGTENHNVTGGIGWGYFNEEVTENPIFTISAMTRVSKRTALVTENWIIPRDEHNPDSSPVYFSYGIRFFRREDQC